MDEYRGGCNNNNDINYFNTSVDETYEVSWGIISEKVLQILRKEPKTKMIFEPLYSRIYRNVCDGKSERMHVDLMKICSRHVSDIEQHLCPPDEFSLEHLISIGNFTKEYLGSIRNIASIFSYLNKFYVSYQLNSDLFTQLAGIFNRMILNERIPVLMYVVEETLKVPCSFSPSILHRFFNDVNDITGGQHSLKYLHLFSKYCVNVLPAMRECDLENHIAEVKEFQARQRMFQTPQENHGLKRPAEDDDMI